MLVYCRRIGSVECHHLDHFPRGTLPRRPIRANSRRLPLGPHDPAVLKRLVVQPTKASQIQTTIGATTHGPKSQSPDRLCSGNQEEDPKTGIPALCVRVFVLQDTQPRITGLSVRKFSDHSLVINLPRECSALVSYPMAAL